MIIEVIMSALCVYALSSLVANYDGPFGIFQHIRRVKWLQSLTSCQVCTAFWCTIPFLYMLSPFEALSAFGLVVLTIRSEP